MTNIDCESFGMAAMAIADGEQSSVNAREIESHLLSCEACREEIEQLRSTDELLSSQKRLRTEEDLWPLISERIPVAKKTAAPFRWRVLLLFGIPLFGYKFLMLVLQPAPNVWAKLVPVILMAAVFSYLKTNPFKINRELTLKESGLS